MKNTMSFRGQHLFVSEESHEHYGDPSLSAPDDNAYFNFLGLANFMLPESGAVPIIFPTASLF